MARASLVERIWYETSVPVFLERFMLPALAAVLVAVILLNPFKLDWQQQGSLAIAVVAVAYFVGHTVHKTNRRVQMPAVLAFEEAALSDMSVFLGANGIEISLPVKRLLRGPANAANLGNGSGIKMYTENGVLYVDATLTDGQRHIEIRKNTFSVTGHSYDKNSSRNAFEVVNERGEPIFQIIRRSAGIIVINGIFAMGDGIAIADNQGLERLPGSAIRPLAVTRIFRYPSWQYPAEYESGQPR